MRRPSAVDVGVRAAQVAFVAALIGTWQLAHSQAWVSPVLLPPPWDVVRAIPPLLTDRLTWTSLQVTLIEILGAYFAALLVGLAVGFAGGLSYAVRQVIEPLLVWAQVVPIVILYPACILLFGLGESSKIVFAGVYAFFPVAYTTMRAIGYVDVRLLAAARSLGASKSAVLFKVAIPSARPLILSGFRLAGALAIIGVFAGQILGSLEGLGYEITASAQLFNVADTYGYIVLALAMVAVLQIAISWSLGGRKRGASTELLSS